MGLFNNHIKNVPPHKLHPQILHWREGDEIENIDFQKMAHKNKFMAVVMRIDGVIPMTTYLYKSLTSDGFIIVEDKESKHLQKVAFEKFIKKASNMSLKSRWVEQELQDSKEYMELIDNFQQAYIELEESDKSKLLE